MAADGWNTDAVASESPPVHRSSTLRRKFLRVSAAGGAGGSALAGSSSASLATGAGSSGSSSGGGASGNNHNHNSHTNGGASSYYNSTSHYYARSKRRRLTLDEQPAAEHQPSSPPPVSPVDTFRASPPPPQPDDEQEGSVAEEDGDASPSPPDLRADSRESLRHKTSVRRRRSSSRSPRSEFSPPADRVAGGAGRRKRRSLLPSPEHGCDEDDDNRPGSEPPSATVYSYSRTTLSGGDDTMGDLFNTVEPKAEHIETLIMMGFSDEQQVKKALTLAKNDISEAVSYLTHETPGLLSASDTTDTSRALVPTCQPRPSSTTGTTDSGRASIRVAENWDDAGGSSSRPSTSDNPKSSETDDVVDMASPNSDSLEFPMTHLYELESRVGGDQWNVPYHRSESLGRCLLAARRLADEKLSDTDEGCQRFINDSFQTSFQKLLTSTEVRNKWNAETLTGIVTMLELLVDLIAARLAYPPVPPTPMLKVLAIAFDAQTNYHQKVRWERLSDDTKAELETRLGGRLTAVEYDKTTPHGRLLEIVNRFAANQGFARIFALFAQQTLTAEEMYHLLQPLSTCVDHLNREVLADDVRLCCEKAAEHVRGISDADLKSPATSFVADLLGSVKQLWRAFWFEASDSDSDAAFVDRLRLDFIMRLLKCPHFGARMQALKEVEKLLNDISEVKKDKLIIPADRLSSWLSDNRVLSVALEGNIDQSQYVERLKTLLSFLGSRLNKEEIAKIWSLRKGRAAVAVDNVFSIIGQAARKFPQAELDHLLELIDKSWPHEDERGKERIVYLLGNIGKETQISYTVEKVADFLWRLAHLKSVGVPVCNLVLSQQLEVVNNKAAPPNDALRDRYIKDCLGDMKVATLPLLSALYHMEALIASMKAKSSVGVSWTSGAAVRSRRRNARSRY